MLDAGKTYDSLEDINDDANMRVETCDRNNVMKGRRATCYSDNRVIQKGTRNSLDVVP